MVHTHWVTIEESDKTGIGLPVDLTDQRIADLLVGRLADGATVSIVGDDHRIAWWHQQP